VKSARLGSLEAMAKAGIITRDEFDGIASAKREKQRIKLLKEMWLEYYKLAWGIDYEEPPIREVKS
jgi:hypothetical protein